MKTETLQRPDFSFLKITFESAGESLMVESGAMISRDTRVEMKTSMKGGLLASAKRKLLGGESLFLNTFSASAASQSLLLAPGSEGDVMEFQLGAGEEMF